MGYLGHYRLGGAVKGEAITAGTKALTDSERQLINGIFNLI